MSYRIGIDARRLQEPGSGDYIQNLVRGLAAVDDDNTYILFLGSRYEGELEDLPESFVRVTERSPVFSLRERFALSWRQLRERLDLYHATHYILPIWVPRRTITTVHDIVDLLYPDFMPGRLSKYIAPAQIRSTLARSDLVIAPSDSTKSDLTAYFDLREKKLRRVYPGIDEAFAEAGAEDDSTLARLGVTGDYVLFRADPRGHGNEERVLRAFAAATAGDHSSIRLVGLGERECGEERFAHLVRSLGLDGRVDWLDDDEASRPALLRHARLFLYPTLREGFPWPVLEAMACGAPAITSRNATIREVTRGAARLVEPSRVKSLERAIRLCLGDESLARELATGGLERVERFRWQRTAREMRKVYEEALGNGGHRGRILPRREPSS